MQVRAVIFPDPSIVVSASRDATSRIWKLTSSNPPTYDSTLSSHGTAFVNTLTYVSPSAEYPEGLIVSGGKDAIIEIRQPSKTPQDNADALLLGHSGNICALDASLDGRTIISGSWDGDARVWQVGKWEGSTVLQGHGGSVWAVLSFDKDTIITGMVIFIGQIAYTNSEPGCADKQIRVFHPSGKLLRTIRGGSDVVRALCKLPAKHSSGAQFASAGNDGVIRLWTLEGLEVAQLHGHENFIYSLAVISNEEIASSSEDRTVRIWRGNQCLQTITHPAISVWSVAACSKNGDIVTGASDRIVRVFSKSADRQGDATAIKAFEDSVKGSAIPQQAIGDVKKEKLPGPDFIENKSGTKEGQVQMIRENNGSISAYQWSVPAQQWINVGTVVDSVGSSGRKVNFEGQDYDYVFDVDIEDGKPPLKLAYNLSQNPYEVAQKFIERNELPTSYVDQVTNFIVTNTQGSTLGQTTGSSTGGLGADPWGTESRYRPGDVDITSSQRPTQAARPKVLPQTEYLTILNANVKMIHKKLLEFNQQLIDNGSKDLSLNPSDQTLLAATVKQLEQSKSTLTQESVDIILKMAINWPPEKRLPALDLLRLAATSPTFTSHTSSGQSSIISILASSGVFASDSPVNNTMLAIRTLVNISASEEGRLILNGGFTHVHDLLERFLATPSVIKQNRNLAVALTTLYINYAVMLGPMPSADRALKLLEDLVAILGTLEDAESLYRGIVALGTVLTGDVDEVKEAATSVFEVKKVLNRVESVGKEPRIKNVGKEIRDLI